MVDGLSGGKDPGDLTRLLAEIVVAAMAHADDAEVGRHRDTEILREEQLILGALKKHAGKAIGFALAGIVVQLEVKRCLLGCLLCDLQRIGMQITRGFSDPQGSDMDAEQADGSDDAPRLDSRHIWDLEAGRPGLEVLFGGLADA